MQIFPAALTAAAVLSATAVASAQTPIITFGSDWSITQSAPLVAGQAAILRYDTDRQPQCRATYHGLPAWAIIASFHGDDSSNVTTVTVNDGSSTANPVDVAITVPYGPDFSVWFHASDEYGCSTWDTNYGQNFHFAVQGPPTVHFKSGWTESVGGTLMAGQTLAVDYDLTRLATCRSTYNGYQAWDVSVYYRFDGGPVSITSVTQVVGSNGRGPATALLTAPSGAHTVEMWFENTDVSGCHAWDSKYGQNYSFTVQ
jgi:hypothetical protein